MLCFPACSASASACAQIVGCYQHMVCLLVFMFAIRRLLRVRQRLRARRQLSSDFAQIRHCCDLGSHSHPLSSAILTLRIIVDDHVYEYHRRSRCHRHHQEGDQERQGGGAPLPVGPAPAHRPADARRPRSRRREGGGALPPRLLRVRQRLRADRVLSCLLRSCLLRANMAAMFDLREI